MLFQCRAKILLLSFSLFMGKHSVCEPLPITALPAPAPAPALSATPAATPASPPVARVVTIPHPVLHTAATAPPAPATEPAPTQTGLLPTPEDTYILTLSQKSPTCPLSRTCPGEGVIEAVCGMNLTDFECGSWWSSGMVGSYRPRIPVQEPSVLGTLRKLNKKECGGCSTSLVVLVLKDSLTL